MGLMKKKSKIQAIDIYHDGLLLTSISVLISIELEIAIFIKPLFLAPRGHIVKNIDL